MKTLLTLLGLVVCWLMVGGPIGPALLIFGLVAISGTYKLTKSGAIDRRSKINIIFLLLGIVLLAVGGFLTSAGI